jgi:DNA-binding NarL/FixJ family response regulator
MGLRSRPPPTFTDEGLRAALLADGAGAVGYLLKDPVLDGAQFIDAIRRVADGGTVMDPEVIARLLARNTGTRSPLSRLSPRELVVMLEALPIISSDAAGDDPGGSHGR